MAYWACARLQLRRETLALHCLKLAGYEIYLPRLRERRVRFGRKIVLTPALFPGYAFVWIELQWHAARWAPGVLGLVMSGDVPVRCPDGVIEQIKRRERGGLVDLPSRLRRGDRVRILRGPFTGHLAIYADTPARDRVAILLALLGGQHRVVMSRGDIKAIEPDVC
jgi:transcriptional antiterminator RfaH